MSRPDKTRLKMEKGINTLQRITTWLRSEKMADFRPETYTEYKVIYLHQLHPGKAGRRRCGYAQDEQKEEAGMGLLPQ